MALWLNLGQVLKVNAKLYEKKVALKDKTRSYTFEEFNDRVNMLANWWGEMGLEKGDKVAVLLDNCIEFVEIYCAAAKTGVVVVPVSFRLVGKEIEYIVKKSDSKAFITSTEFSDNFEEIRHLLSIEEDRYIIVGEGRKGYLSYEELLKCSDEEPEAQTQVQPQDPWVILYTSGTTGVPKGVVRSHESYVAFFLLNAIDFGFSEKDICLTVMPLYHVNSTFFSFTFTYIGGTLYIHSAKGFDPVEILRIIDKEKITFISLVPTHYNLILNVPPQEAKRYDVSSIRKLLCSSAPVRPEVKKAVMEFFPKVELYEAYGSTEAGSVTILKPDEQLEYIGSIGREICGTDFVRILDEEGKEVPVGQVGELYSRGPMLFTEYYKDPERTKQSFRGEWFSAGDMAKKDKDGYYYLVDRKHNMIITGGENVYPSEVEKVISQHPAVLDVAVIGLPHEKWGEAVTAVVSLKEGKKATEEEIIDFCRGKMASFKRPKSVIFIKDEEMPRTPTGKILHRKLRERFGK
jgi:acyl-CoA synthetase (AMP-forming)/AMP-acid ligase II